MKEKPTNQQQTGISRDDSMRRNGEMKSNFAHLITNSAFIYGYEEGFEYATIYEREQSAEKDKRIAELEAALKEANKLIDWY